MALILSRRIDEAIVIQTPAGPMRVVLLRVERNARAVLAIEAPECMKILREELLVDEAIPDVNCA
jgi:carbon storage regulator CsrA